MIKRLTGLVFVMIATAFIVIGCSEVNDPALDNNSDYGSMSAFANGDGIPANSASVNLIAGRTEDVGEVSCWIKGDRLFVLYSTDMDWKLAGTQLVVAGSKFDIELTKSGNPKIGHFPWKNEHEPPVDEYLYSIALDELGFDYAGELVIAAHAGVLLYSEEGAVEREEGAWAYGERFIGVETEYTDRIEKPDYLKDDGGSDILDKESVDSGNWSMYFTVFGWQITVRELTMNEIYYSGCNYSRFYYYDQFIELYNASPDTIWLDGYLVCRNTQIPDIIDPEAEDYALAYYVFAFPGETGVTRECPIAPEQFLVLASDAIDHSAYGGGWCVDLAGADWEFFNPLGSDYDNPGVPNLTPISNRTSDFLMNLTHTAVYIATGKEWEYGYHYDYNSGDMKEYIHIPLWTIVDAVEYSSNSDVPKYITYRIDAGLAGTGIAKYSATSIQRWFPGLDSNNSTFDFGIVYPPTPGYQSQ